MSIAPAASAPDIDRFQEELARAHLHREWQLETALAKGEAGARAEQGAFVPKTAGKPHLWPWAMMRPLLERSLEMVPESYTARRALGLYNPGLARGATQTIAAGVQII